MGQGLYFNPGDGGPAMEITAGLRCPTMSAQWNTSDWQQMSTTISNVVPGSTMFIVPRVAAVYRPAFSPDLIPTIFMLDGYTISGNTVTQQLWRSKNNDNNYKAFDASLWQILPATQSGNTGLLIQDSTDWTAIPSATMAGFCVWRGSITVSGEALLPDTGYPQSQQIVFADWSAPGVTIECDGTRIYAYRDRLNYYDDPATVTLTLAIFASGIPPVPGPGLTIMNAANECVFSLTKRPFVFTGAMWTPGMSPVDIGPTMVPLGTFGFDSDIASGWDILKLLGIIRNGNVIQLGRGKVKARWTDKYPVTGRRIASLTLPLIPKMY